MRDAFPVIVFGHYFIVLTAGIAMSSSRSAVMVQDMPLEPGKVFTHLTHTLLNTRTRFEDYSAGVTRLLRLKAGSCSLVLPSGLYIHTATVVQDDIFSNAASRKPLTSQQLTSLAVISSSLLLRQAQHATPGCERTFAAPHLLILHCSKAAVEEQLKGVDAEAQQSLEQAKALPTVCICKHM